MRKMVLALLLLLPPAFSFAATPTAPPVIDNPRVLVRDVTLTPGGEGLTPDPAHPFVVMVLNGGGIRVTQNGKNTTRTYAPGEALYGAKGAGQSLAAASGMPRLIVVTLKEANPPPPLANKSGLPLAFPREGSRKILENDRVVVWNYTWIPGRATPMHFHDKDVVLVYRKDGAVSSTTQDGQVTINEDKTGQIKFNQAARIHSEKLVRGEESAIITELK